MTNADAPKPKDGNGNGAEPRRPSQARLTIDGLRALLAAQPGALAWDVVWRTLKTQVAATVLTFAHKLGCTAAPARGAPGRGGARAAAGGASAFAARPAHCDAHWQLFALDVVLDARGRSFVVEINPDPSLKYRSDVIWCRDLGLYGDLYAITGLRPRARRWPCAAARALDALCAGVARAGRARAPAPAHAMVLEHEHRGGFELAFPSAAWREDFPEAAQIVQAMPGAERSYDAFAEYLKAGA